MITDPSNKSTLTTSQLKARVGRPAYWHWNLIHPVALCPPAVRMVCVVAYAEMDGDRITTDFEEFRVLAIRSVLQLSFRKPRVNDVHPNTPTSREGMLANGWEEIDGFEKTETLILLDGKISAPDELADYHHAAIEIVPCDWPSVDDPSRLREWRDRAVTRASAKFRSWLGSAAEKSGAK